MKIRKTAKTVKSPRTAKSETRQSMKAAIHGASASLKSGVTNTEYAALAASGRMEDGMEAVKAQFEDVKQFGNELVDVVDNAGRTAIGSVVAMNGSLMTFGREALNDTLETSRKSFEVKTFKDAIDLQTEFTERRLKAMFSTMGALNSLAQSNTLAMWSPVADMLRAAGDKGDENIKTTGFKSMI